MPQALLGTVPSDGGVHASEQPDACDQKREDYFYGPFAHKLLRIDDFTSTDYKYHF